MRILQVITTDVRRGAEVFAVELGRSMSSAGDEVETVALTSSGSAEPLTVSTLGSRRLALSTLRSLRTTARQFDVVVAHGSTTLPACALALFGTGVPFVYRNIGDPRYWNRSRVQRLRTRLLLRRASRVVAIASRARDELVELGVSAARLAVIPNGADPDVFQPPTSSERTEARRALQIVGDIAVVLYMGSLTPEKRVDLVIEALPSSGPLLVIAGDGERRAALEQLVAQRGLHDRVRFLGQRRDPYDVYAASDVVVLASESEGLPGVLIEAGMSGLPVVATDAGYVADVIDDGVTGFIVPRGDITAIGAAITEAIERKASLGSAARDRCTSRFSFDEVSRAWRELLHTVRPG